MKMSPKVGQVLQGYFRVEQFCSKGNKATGIQPAPSGRSTPLPPRPDRSPAPPRSVAVQSKPASSASGVPRPDLLPAKMRGMVSQTKSEREASPPSSRAPRPELLPGMGPAVAGRLRVVAQARLNNGVSATPLPASHLRVIGEGRPLEPKIRQTMEAFFQADFSGVRVHEGPTAHAMGALAFTLGEDLHFAPGLYDPASRVGVELLGHELTHVVQQRAGRVVNPFGTGVAIVQDPALEAEADRMGEWVANQIVSGRHPRLGAARAVARDGHPLLSRHRAGVLLSRTMQRMEEQPSNLEGNLGGRSDSVPKTDTRPKLTVEVKEITEWTDEITPAVKDMKKKWKEKGGNPQGKPKEEYQCSGDSWTMADEGVDVAGDLADAGERKPDNAVNGYQKIFIACYQGESTIRAVMIIEARTDSCSPDMVHLYIRWLLGCPNTGGGKALVKQAKRVAKERFNSQLRVDSARSAEAWYKQRGFVTCYHSTHVDDYNDAHILDDALDRRPCGCRSMKWIPNQSN